MMEKGTRGGVSWLIIFLGRIITVIAHSGVNLESSLDNTYFSCSLPGCNFLPPCDNANINDAVDLLTPKSYFLVTEVYYQRDGDGGPTVECNK